MLFKSDPTPEQMAEELDKLGVEYYGIPASKYVHHIVTMERRKKDKVGNWYTDGHAAYTTVDGRLQILIDLHSPSHREYWKGYWGEDRSPTWRVRFEHHPHDERLADYLLITCYVESSMLPFGVAMGTATAYLSAKSGADSTNPVENAETSALGRALGNAGIGILPGGGKASAEEVTDAIRRDASKTRQSKPTNPTPNGSKSLMGRILYTLGQHFPEENYSKEERAKLFYNEVEEACALNGIKKPDRHSTGGPDLRKMGEEDLAKIADALESEE